jgi:hypothetical protein
VPPVFQGGESVILETEDDRYRASVQERSSWSGGHDLVGSGVRGTVDFSVSKEDLIQSASPLISFADSDGD